MAVVVYALVLALLVHAAVAFRVPTTLVARRTARLAEPKDVGGKWKVDDDTAEIEWGSSTDLKRAAEAAKPKSFMGSLAPSSSSSGAGGNQAVQPTSGFDIGLLIAFPIIVGTLGFFFLFPILGPELAKVRLRSCTGTGDRASRRRLRSNSYTPPLPPSPTPARAQNLPEVPKI